MHPAPSGEDGPRYLRGGGCRCAIAAENGEQRRMARERMRFADRLRPWRYTHGARIASRVHVCHREENWRYRALHNWPSRKTVHPACARRGLSATREAEPARVQHSLAFRLDFAAADLPSLAQTHVWGVRDDE
jgi:hypothetical protein